MKHTKLKLAFAGTPEIARIVLESLIHANQHSIGIVFTKPDKPAGRGHKIRQSEVKICAIKNNIEIQQPKNYQEFESCSLENYDLLLVVAYGLLLTPKILTQPKFGCINIHASLLPRWRGAAPIQRAIEAGDMKTGITIMQMDKKLDTGKILKQISCSIKKDDTSGILHDRLANISAKNINNIISKIAEGQFIGRNQDNSKATYAKKISKYEAELDWNKTAIELERKIRAYNPTPIAHTSFKGTNFRVWEARVKPSSVNLKPGTLVKGKSTIDIMTGKNLLSITKLQLPGKKIISARDFLNSHAGFMDD